MNSLTRLIGYSLLLLLVFLAATLGAQSWLRQQTTRLRAEAIEARRAQFDAVLQILNRPVDQWDDSYQRQLGDMIGGTVSIQRAGVVLPPKDPALLYVERGILQPASPARLIRVAFPAPPTARLMATYQQVTVGLLLFGAALLLAGAFFAVLNWRSSESAGSARTELQDSARAEMDSLTHLAKTSVAQGAELSLERDGRRLAEQDALLKQQLLNQSLEGKIRLGHDLHDGIIQSLYATGLTIETARKLAHRPGGGRPAARVVSPESQCVHPRRAELHHRPGPGNPAPRRLCPSHRVAHHGARRGLPTRGAPPVWI